MVLPKTRSGPDAISMNLISFGACHPHLKPVPDKKRLPPVAQPKEVGDLDQLQPGVAARNSWSPRARRKCDTSADTSLQGANDYSVLATIWNTNLVFHPVSWSRAGLTWALLMSK